jgi:hypothetical protein
VERAVVGAYDIVATASAMTAAIAKPLPRTPKYLHLATTGKNALAWASVLSLE